MAISSVKPYDYHSIMWQSSFQTWHNAALHSLSLRLSIHDHTWGLLTTLPPAPLGSFTDSDSFQLPQQDSSMLQIDGAPAFTPLLPSWSRLQTSPRLLKRHWGLARRQKFWRWRWLHNDAYALSAPEPSTQWSVWHASCSVNPRSVLVQFVEHVCLSLLPSHLSSCLLAG